eukprot:g18896.t1
MCFVCLAEQDEKAIWQADEFKAASGVVVKSEGDDRAIPKYEILPRQKLQASDAYLNLQEMDPSSDRCQELLIKVWLPGEQLRDISVDVLEDRLLLQATKHQLNVALPHKVRKDAGNAKWDKLQGVLSVCVPIDQKVKPAMFKDETRTLRQAGFQEIDYVFVGHGAPCGPDESMLKVSRYTYENGNHKVSDGFTFPARGDMSVRSFKEALVKVCADWEEAQRTDADARPGYDAYDASEYVDSPDVLEAKVKLLAAMWRRSGADAVVYTGAGLSTASGIGDYASRAGGSIAPHRAKGTSTGSRLELQPTTSPTLWKSFAARNWVQQNHDRLAQKAGFPQAKLNEIHGAWGDTKNMVKMMDDTLRSDLLEWLVAWSARASLCVTLGTSLCGMTSDEIPRAAAERFAVGQGDGLVIIGLQRTFYDEAWQTCL